MGGCIPELVDKYGSQFEQFRIVLAMHWEGSSWRSWPWAFTWKRLRNTLKGDISTYALVRHGMHHRDIEIL